MVAWWGDDEDNLFKMRYGFDDLELIGDHMFTIGVPSNSNETFRKYVFAAAKAYNLGIKMDYTYKKYSSNWNLVNQDEDVILITSALNMIKETFIDNLDYIMSIKNKPDDFNLFMCSASLVRLQNTFKSASILIKSYMHFEAVSMLRIILEQLAWIFTVHNSIQICTDIKPTACIKNLKKIYPLIGNLYGELSTGVHMSSDSFTKFVRLDDDDFSIHLTDIEEAKYDAFILIYLLDVFSVVGEFVYANLITEHRFIQKVGDLFELKEDRMTKLLLDKYIKLLRK
ncbi:hypothetical protein [Paenibacillus tengchongensis]|uniref:hypothetical protein n=1 Tax=Paenibacillus tengchongensis TaxID=2608684 RepID=UPI00124BE8FE|nr:hypothetical protein [Paenibacillus tengchongensis]